MIRLVTRAGGAQQRVLRFLQRPEHGLPVLRELPGRFRVARGDPRTHAADVEERPVDAERDQVRVAARAEEPVAARRTAEQPRQRETRKQVGRRDADACGRRVQPCLGGRDVGTPPQQVARRAGIDVGGQRRQRHGRARRRGCLREIEAADQRVRRLSGQHREPVLVDADRRFVHGDPRRRRFVLRARPRRIEFRASPRADARIDQRERLLLVVGVLACNPQPLLRAAQIDVCARHLAGDRDAHRTHVRRAGGRFRTLRLDRTTHAAEQVGSHAALIPTLDVGVSRWLRGAPNAWSCSSADGRSARSR